MKIKSTNFCKMLSTVPGTWKVLFKHLLHKIINIKVCAVSCGLVSPDVYLNPYYFTVYHLILTLHNMYPKKEGSQFC